MGNERLIPNGSGNQPASHMNNYFTPKKSKISILSSVQKKVKRDWIFARSICNRREAKAMTITCQSSNAIEPIVVHHHPTRSRSSSLLCWSLQVVYITRRLSLPLSKLHCCLLMKKLLSSLVGDFLFCCYNDDDDDFSFY